MAITLRKMIEQLQVIEREHGGDLKVGVLNEEFFYCEPVLIPLLRKSNRLDADDDADDFDFDCDSEELGDLFVLMATAFPVAVESIKKELSDGKRNDN